MEQWGFFRFVSEINKRHDGSLSISVIKIKIKRLVFIRLFINAPHSIARSTTTHYSPNCVFMIYFPRCIDLSLAGFNCIFNLSITTTSFTENVLVFIVSNGAKLLIFTFSRHSRIFFFWRSGFKISNLRIHPVLYLKKLYLRELKMSKKKESTTEPAYDLEQQFILRLPPVSIYKTENLRVIFTCKICVCHCMMH